MWKRGILRPVACTLAVVLLASACRKEEDEARWDVDVAVPLIRTTLTIGDLIGDTLIGTDGQGNVSLIYSARLFEFGLDTLMAIPDTTFRDRYPTDLMDDIVPFDLPPGFNIPTNNDPIHFDLDQLELRELRVKSGFLDFSITNRLNTSILGGVLLETATLNGAPLHTSLNVAAGSVASPSTLAQSTPLDGYIFDLRGPDFDEVNTLARELELQTDPAGPTVTMDFEDSLVTIVSYRDIKPRYARGYFGQRDIEVDADTSELSVFDGMSGLLDIDAVTAVLRVRNGIGLDARANIHHIRSVNRNTGNVVDLDHAIISAPLNLDRALDLGDSFQPATNAYTLDNANSNIDEFIENLPDAIAFDMDMLTNPLGDVSNGNDFFYDESELSADLDVDIPLRLIASDLSLSRRTTVDLEGTLENHAFRYGTLHFFAENRFPFSARVKLSVETFEGTVLDTLAPGGTIAPAQMGPDGLVSAATATQLDFAVNEQQLDLFYPGSAGGADGARLRITVVFNTTDQSQHVQLRSDYTIDITVSLEGNYIVNGDE